MGTKLRRLLAEMHHDDVLKVGTILHLLDSDTSEGDMVRWVDVSDAAAAIGIPESTLRRRASRWLGMDKPPVHVRKRGSNRNAQWEFRESDLAAEAQRQQRIAQASTDEPQAEGDVDETEALMDHYGRLVTRDL